MKPMLSATISDTSTIPYPVNVSAKLDGCFSASTLIWTSEGLLQIEEIVKKQLRVQVASYNEETGCVEMKPIIGWFDNGQKGASEWMSFSSKRKVTKNHHVFSPCGWVPASESNGDGFQVDPNLCAAITGMLLGDSCASIEKRSTGDHTGWRLTWSNCEADMEYGRLKAAMLAQWLDTRERNFISGYGHPQTSFTTSVCRALPYDIRRFYDMDKDSENYGRRKRDLSLCDLQEGFTDLSLAIWYFDDGCIQDNNGNASTPRIHFSVARYSEATLEAIKDLFRVKYAVVPTIERYGKDIKMSFTSPDSVYLLWRIGAAAGGMMPRKMVTGALQSLPTISRALQWLPTLVKKPVSEDSQKKWSAYDIEVEGNHNYFAEGQLVHNCRALVIDGVVLSRNLKPFRNKHVQALFGKPEYNGFDGELLCGPANAKDVYRKTNSGVMSEDGQPDVTYHVFDRWDMPDVGFQQRLDTIKAASGVVKVTQWRVNSEEELLSIESQVLADGYEGLMVRNDDTYKEGRSTLKEFKLAKLKRFVDAEYEVVGYTERMENQNEKTTDALGHSKRSSHQENKVGRGDLGAIICRTVEGLEFNCGTGFDDNQRRQLWEIKDSGLIGRWAKVKSFLIGVKDLPRFPVFLGFRDPIDL